jgi:hypothetical protein
MDFECVAVNDRRMTMIVSADAGDETSVTSAAIKGRLNLGVEIASMRSLSDLRADDGLHWHQALLDRVSINLC